MQRRSGGPPPSGSATGLNTSFAYAANPLRTNGYLQNQLLARQYQQQLLAQRTQQQLLAAQNQIAVASATIAEQQRLARVERESQVIPNRLARAEAKRAARAQRAAARLEALDSSPTTYSLASVRTDSSPDSDTESSID